MHSFAQSPITHSRGSEWRRWDLQIHTPFSALNNGFGSDFSRYAKELIKKACDENLAVAGVGITDYFTIEGYKALRKVLDNSTALVQLVGVEDAEKVAKILFIPNIELRLKIIVQNKGVDSRVNIHVLFSDEVSPEDIENHFLHDLKFTAIANPDGLDERWSLTPLNLEELGRRLKAEHAKFRDRSDLYVGMMNAVIDDGEMSEILENKKSKFKDKYLICFPCDEDLSRLNWDGQGHLSRKLLIQKSHLLLSSNPNTRAFGLGQKHITPEAFKAEFKGLKPCIHSSDPHTFEKLFTPDDGRYTWIKADPTFYGLRQLLNEPEDRVFIGYEPPSKSSALERSTKIIKSVEIRKVPGALLAEKWFDCSIDLNPELIAIIGNKGSGKSALSDVLGLLGNTPRYNSFSFLNDKRFRDPKINKSRSFYASLKWADGTVDPTRTLNSNPEAGSVEKVKYIPQNYLEEICNEVSSGEGSKFNQELKEVIFSHVPEVDRLGCDTLDDLLAHRTAITDQAVQQFTTELHDLNTQIIAVENRLLLQHRKSIDAQLAEKQRELVAHNQARPPEVPKPENVVGHEQSRAAEEILISKNAELKTLNNELTIYRINLTAIAKKLATLEDLRGKLKNLEHQVEGGLSTMSAELSALNLEWQQVINFAINFGPLDDLRQKFTTRRTEITNELDPSVMGSTEAKRQAKATETQSIQAQLTAPQKAYQTYVEALQVWEDTLARIVGSPITPNSIEWIQAQLNELDELPDRLQLLEKRRAKKLVQIYEEKQKLRDYYKAYYGDVQRFLTNHHIAAAGSFQLTFNVSIVETGFVDAFINRLDLRKLGPFMGENGRAKIVQLINRTNFDSAFGTLRFVAKIFKMMHSQDGEDLTIKEQLRQHVSVKEFYDFVFSLGFLTPNYNLLWEGKSIDQLSPGERGNLLLIFYLLVDQAQIPLIIDQPEENLDNQTVYRTPVPCIKDAKKRRQIIIVTHNPNLAVVCDAEQVICAEIEKGNEHTVIYTSGSIEHPGINQRIVDILEGTRPAFDKRDDKYIP